MRGSSPSWRTSPTAEHARGSELSPAWTPGRSMVRKEPVRSWSPDGGSLAFFTRERLARVAVSGGSPVPICEVGGGVGRSGSWGAGGEILFADVQGDAIYGVSADGGKPEAVVRSDPTRGVFRVQWPSFLPDGRSFLYLAWGAISSRSADGTLMLARPGKPPTAVTPLRSRAEMLEPGYLIFAREGALFGQRFDPISAKLAGPPLPIAASVNYFLSTGFADFTARAGTLAYHSQEDVMRLTWFDRAGRALGSVGGPGRYVDVAIAPDGKRFLFSRARPGIWTFDIWMFDIARGVETPITSEPGSEFGGLWLPDGKSILYPSPGDAHRSWSRADSPAARSSQSSRREVSRWRARCRRTPDSRLLRARPGRLLRRVDPAARERREAREFCSGAPADSLLFSPDGRAVAFLSSESGRQEAYVAPFGSPGEKVRVSTDGANLLRFSRDGTELFYLSPDGRLIAVQIRTVPSVEPGEPRTLFRLAPGPGWQNFDVAPDGRFLAVVSEVSGSAQPATVVVNWTAEAPKK